MLLVADVIGTTVAPIVPFDAIMVTGAIVVIGAIVPFEAIVVIGAIVPFEAIVVIEAIVPFEAIVVIVPFEIIGISQYKPDEMQNSNKNNFHKLKFYQKINYYKCK